VKQRRREEEEEEEHDGGSDDGSDDDDDDEEEDEERNGDEGGVSARSGYLQNHSRAIYRGPSPARYRFNFKLKFMNGLLPFCRIRLRTFSGPGRRAILPGRDSAAVTLARRAPRYSQGRLFNKTSSAGLVLLVVCNYKSSLRREKYRAPHRLYTAPKRLPRVVVCCYREMDTSRCPLLLVNDDD